MATQTPVQRQAAAKRAATTRKRNAAKAERSRYEVLGAAPEHSTGDAGRLPAEPVDLTAGQPTARMPRCRGLEMNRVRSPTFSYERGVLC